MKKLYAFTLVELLVVIAVMTALIAILIPAMGTARQIAYKITCLNNLKQLGIAVQVYTQQYKVYPVCVPNDSNVTWAKFIANPDIAKDAMLGVPVSLWPFHKEKKLYDCPILTRKGAEISYCYNWLAGRELAAGEPAFASITPSYIPPVPPEEKKTDFYFLTPDRVKSPKTFVILYDLPLIPEPLTSTGNPNLYQNIDPDDYDSSESDPNKEGNLWHYKVLKAVGPHTGGYDILFADGHVKLHKEWSDSEMTRKPD
ncbi:MAG: type II secretion system protein [Phycisphaerae bacterium]|jgi:prepilin-type processing-associated H-X9-DG protein